MFDWAKPVLRSRSATEIYLLFVAFVLPWQDHQIMRKGITLFHVTNSILTCCILASLMLRGPRPRWPFIIPMYVYLVGSVLGMFNSEVLSINLYTLLQDIYLYIWFVVLCVFLNSRERVAILALAWAMMIVIVVSHEGFFLGATGGDRLEFTFKNPNRAAAYMTLSFFILYHPVVPWVLKIFLGLVLYNAIATTGSAAASIGLLLGIMTSIGAFFYIASPPRFRFLQPLAIIVLALLVVGSSRWAGRDLNSIVEEIAPAAEGRVERSSSTRQEIWAAGMKSFREHPLGIGPASFHKQIITDVTEKGTIELHSDFVAALVERGLVGLAGFLLLLGAVIVTIFRLMHASARYGDLGDKIWAAALTGACSAYFFYSITHEALHHETYWLMLALIVSQYAIVRKPRDATRGWVEDEASYLEPEPAIGIAR